VADLAHTVSLLAGVALFRRQALVALAGAPALSVVCVPLLAGLSEMAGQSFVLVTRRVRLLHAIASYALTALVHVAAVAAWTWVALALFQFGNSAHTSSRLIFGVVAACYAPRLLGILTIAPYYGELLGRGLDAWTMACVGWGLFAVAGLSLGAAMLCACAGWTANHIIRHFGSYLSAPIFDRLGLIIGGAPSV